MNPLPTQLSGAAFLAGADRRLLADAPRVGKTGAAILAADAVGAKTVLVITTASGRGVWRRAFGDWSTAGRTVDVPMSRPGSTADAVIYSWAGLNTPSRFAAMMAREWDLLILDEAHYAKTFTAKRTRRVYGGPVDDGARLLANGLSSRARRVWPLTGTPVPNAPNDLYPMMRALCPERLAAMNGWPDVTCESDFLARYCVTRPKRISRFRSIQIVVGGRNEAELRERLDGFVLRRTQKDVGIREPIYETFPLVADAASRRIADGDVDREAILAAAERGDTRGLEMHLGTLRRLTGVLKAPLVAEAVSDELDSGTDKVVVMYWHREVGAQLVAALAGYGPVTVSGDTSAKDRDAAAETFRTNPNCRVFVGQITAAGEAIDLSAAPLLVFAESSFVPKDMAQAALRITNHSQRQTPIVRVAAMAGSIDDALQTVLLRKWSTIREVMT